MAALWPHAPDPQALDFCLRWLAYNRALQQRAGDSSFDSDGAIGVGPVITPRLTPVASRCEAAVATLDIARRAGVQRQRELDALEAQLRRSLALLLRQRFVPGPRHLFKNPQRGASARCRGAKWTGTCASTTRSTRGVRWCSGSRCKVSSSTCQSRRRHYSLATTYAASPASPLALRCQT